MVNFTLRLPPILHAAVAEIAKQDGRSMQMWIQRTLESALPKDMLADTARKELRNKQGKK